MHSFTSQKSQNKPYKQIIMQQIQANALALLEQRLFPAKHNAISALPSYIASSSFFASLVETGGDRRWKSRERHFTLHSTIDLDT